MRYDLAALARRSGIRRKAIVLRPIDPPATLAGELARIAGKIVRLWAAGLKDSVLPSYEASLERITRDEASDPLRQALDSLQARGKRLVLEVEPELRTWGLRVEGWHQARWAAGVQAGTGVDSRLFLSTQDAADQIKAHQEWASGLIRNIDEDMRRRVETATYQGLLNQTSRREIGKQLSEALGIARRRANLIAADQTLKLAGKLDQLRQTEAGIEEYKWRHGGKAHPRLHHVERDGKIFRWDTPPWDGHPKMAIHCGCSALAYINLEEVTGAEKPKIAAKKEPTPKKPREPKPKKQTAEELWREMMEEQRQRLAQTIREVERTEREEAQAQLAAAMQQDPDRVRKAEALIDFGAGVGEAFRDEVKAAAATLPRKVLDGIAAQGVRIKAGRTVVEVFPHLAGKAPRGWAAGSTWESVSGVYVQERRSVGIGEYTLSRAIGKLSRETSRSTAGGTRHEVGHALDFTSGVISNTAEFKLAYQDDFFAIMQLPEGKREALAYLIQPGEAGRQEAFAELFAFLHGGGGLTISDLDRYFPKVAAFIRRLLA